MPQATIALASCLPQWSLRNGSLQPVPLDGATLAQCNDELVASADRFGALFVAAGLGVMVVAYVKNVALGLSIAGVTHRLRQALACSIQGGGLVF